ncbi:complement C1q-like protein 4 [Engraulis encrasicolus]|uniref:complement C1q-like protein 4 n=1 Tax=Engraulis encrasicolus TaxID=184585 RepID=UPI002FD0F529
MLLIIMKSPGAVVLMLWLGLLLVAAAEADDVDQLELKYIRSQVQDFETRLRTSEKQMRDLQRKCDKLQEDNSVLKKERDQSKVSFSASLMAQGEISVSHTTNLAFNRIIVNIGNAYNPNTGIFTAPIRGVYFFIVFAFGKGSMPTGAYLYKNEEKIVYAYAYAPSSDYWLKPSNGASLLLEVGDEVCIKVYSGESVYDNWNHHTSFSGHLLFPM